MIELHIIDYTSFTSKAGKAVRIVSLWYKNKAGFCNAGNYFVPESYAGPDPKPGSVMHGVIYHYKKDGKDVDTLVALDK